MLNSTQPIPYPSAGGSPVGRLEAQSIRPAALSAAALEPPYAFADLLSGAT